MKRSYSDEFKLSVIKDYYSSSLGVRAIAAKYNLPSKNYINNWEQYLKKKDCFQAMPQNHSKQLREVKKQLRV